MGVSVGHNRSVGSDLLIVYMVIALNNYSINGILSMCSHVKEMS